MKSKSLLKGLGICILVGTFALNLAACSEKKERPKKAIMWSNGKSIEVYENETRDLPPPNISLSRGYLTAFDDDGNLVRGELSFHFMVWDYGQNKGIKSIEIYEDGELLKRIANAEVKEPTKEPNGVLVDYTNEEEQFSGHNEYDECRFHRSVWFDVKDRIGEHEYFIKVVDKGGHEIKTKTIAINHDEFKKSSF